MPDARWTTVKTRPAQRVTAGGPEAAPIRTGTVALLVATALAVMVQLYVSIPLQRDVAADLGADSVTAALAAGYAACYAAGFLVFGPLSDHVGRRPVLLGGLLAFSVTTVAVGLVPSVEALGIARAVQGGAAATFAPTALAMLGEGLPPHRRAQAIGAMSVAFLAAGIIGQVSATALANAYGWRWVFFGGAMVLAILTTALARALTENSPLSSHGLSLMSRYTGLGRFAAHPASMLLGLAHLMVLGGFVALYTLLGPQLAHLGLAEEQVMLARAAALPAMFVCLLAGRISSRVGPIATVGVAFLIAALGLGAQALGAGSVLVLTAASVVFVAGISIAVPMFIALWGEASAPARGIGMAVNGFVLFLGASLGPYAAALPASFSATLGLLACGYLAATVLVRSSVRIRCARGDSE